MLAVRCSSFHVSVNDLAGKGANLVKNRRPAGGWTVDLSVIRPPRRRKDSSHNNITALSDVGRGSRNRPSSWRAFKQVSNPCSTTRRSSTDRSSGLEGELKKEGGRWHFRRVVQIRKFQLAASASQSSAPAFCFAISTIVCLTSYGLLSHF